MVSSGQRATSPSFLSLGKVHPETQIGIQIGQYTSVTVLNEGAHYSVLILVFLVDVLKFATIILIKHINKLWQ